MFKLILKSRFLQLRSERGMTLIEILAVVVLLGLILTVVARGIMGKSEAAQAQLNVVKMNKLKQSIGQYRLEFGKYPTRLDDMLKPTSEIQKAGKLFVPLVEDEDLKDLWGFDFIYRSEENGRSYSLTSYGANGVQGGDGPDQDITLTP